MASEAGEAPRMSEFVVAPPRTAPGVSSMVGYRALQVPNAVHRRDGAGLRPEVAHAWHLLHRSRGTAPVAGIAERVGLSQRHLNTLFRREVGRTPKTVAMLMRFEHAIARIAGDVRRAGRVDLAQIAADTGYCDQAHLTREFVRFAGTSPRAWLAEEFQNIQDGGHAHRSEFEP